MDDLATQGLCWNFKLLAHHELGGFGGMGEGLAIQIAPDGRRILWMAHESAPKNFTAVDVTDPRDPKLVVQTDLAEPYRRSNSLDVVGNIMAVAYQCQKQGQTPAGMELFDISDPEHPKSLSFFDTSGPHSRGVHQLWFADGEYVHMATGAADFTPRHPLDDQFYMIVDVRDVKHPREVGRWWLPGTREGDAEPPPPRHQAPLYDAGFHAHNTNVYPQRPDRCYLGYIDGGMMIMDISDKSAPKMISRWDNSPPFPGFTHTVLPLFERGLLVVSDESIMEDGKDAPKLLWMVDARDETNLVPIATFPPPPMDVFRGKGGRVGAHNLHENGPQKTSWFSDQIIVGTFFNAGVRAYDISDPFRPREIAWFVPPPPPLSPVGAIQINDVLIDERGIVYTVDRHVGGLYILEMDF
jgi:hypothetical protein